MAIILIGNFISKFFNDEIILLTESAADAEGCQIPNGKNSSQLAGIEFE